MEGDENRSKRVGNAGSLLLSLPDDLLEKILGMLRTPTVGDVLLLAEVCRRFREAIKSMSFRRSVDIIRMERPEGWDAILSHPRFLTKFLEAGNPSAIFAKGVEEYFAYKNLGGIDLIKQSADKGYEWAVYCFGFYQKLIRNNPEGDVYLLKMTRAKIVSFSTAIWRDRYRSLFWRGTGCDAFVERKNNYSDVEKRRGCRVCAANRLLPLHLRTDPCDSCFWLCEGRKYLNYFPRTVKQFSIHPVRRA